jgi:NAD(P)H-dependent FMN reductase
VTALGNDREPEHRGDQMSNCKVGYFIGSLSTSSINRLLAKALARLASAELDMTEILIGNLPLYNRDYDNDYPPVARTFKDAIASVEAVLFVTPEYNRSIPGALKNAIDWASRPYGTNRAPASPRLSSERLPARSARPSDSNICGAFSASATRRR